MLVYFYTALSIIVFYSFCQQQIYSYSNALFEKDKPQVIYKRRCGWLYFSVLVSFVFAFSWSDELLKSLFEVFSIGQVSASEQTSEVFSIDSLLGVPPEQRCILLALLLFTFKSHSIFQRIEKPFLDSVTDALGGKEEFDRLQKRILDSYQYYRADINASKAIQDQVNNHLKDFEYDPSNALEKKIRGAIVHLVTTKHHRTFSKDDKISAFVTEACLLFSRKKENDRNHSIARTDAMSTQLSKSESKSKLAELDEEHRKELDSIESELSMLVWRSLVSTLKKMTTSISNMSQLSRQLSKIHIRLPKENTIGSGFGWKAFALSIPVVLISTGLYISFLSPYSSNAEFMSKGLEQYSRWSVYWLLMILIGIFIGFIATRFQLKVRENTEESFYKKLVIYSCLSMVIYYVSENLLKSNALEFPEPTFAPYVLYAHLFFCVSFAFLTYGASDFNSKKELSMFSKFTVRRRTLTNLAVLLVAATVPTILFLLTLKTESTAYHSLLYLLFMLVNSMCLTQILYHCAYKSAKRRLHNIERDFDRLKIEGRRLDAKITLPDGKVYEGKLIDFSEEGCCIDLENELDDKMTVTLMIREVELPSKSIWHAERGTFHKHYKSGFRHTDVQSATVFMERLRELGYDKLIVDP